MHAISRRYHKPKSRPSKKSRNCQEMLRKRYSTTLVKKDISVNIPSSNEQMLCDKISENSDNDKLAGNKNTFNNLSTAKLEMLPSTSACQETVSEKSSYILMSNDIWSTLLSNVKCEDCHTHSLDVISKGSFGFATKIELFCKNCGKVFSSTFSSPRESESRCFEANKKFVEAFINMGQGHSALEVFSMAIGIHAMDKKTFSKCLNKLYEEKKSFKNDILSMSRNLVRQKHQGLTQNANSDIIDIGVSYDGTWQKRGHTSLYGIGIVIDILTGIIIDFEILSKYCSQCTAAKRDLGSDNAEFSIWYEGHKLECAENYTGSSNSMEMKAAEILWKRSVEVCKMRYTTILSDGDAKTYQHLSNLNVYGSNVKITKEECINHVAKRLGTGLRNKITEWRSKGVTLGGRKEGGLKEETIIKLTNYYRKAIKNNAPNVDKMKEAIYASLLHCSSSDETPKHNKCPTGSNSWCFYQRALENCEIPKSHKTMKTKLSQNVLEKIMPVYQRLASNEILERCISGKTQNMNESAHSVIWKNCSKETFVSVKRLEILVISSISEFNFGYLNTLSTEKEVFNSFSVSIAERRDKRRLDQIKKRSSSEWKKKNILKKISKSRKNKQNTVKEGETYSSGKF